MRVKITKTIPVDDLPPEVRRMVDSVKNRIMYSLSDSIGKITRSSLATSADEYFQTIDLIDSFRQELSALDENLQEITNILTGHKNALFPPEQPPEEHEEEWPHDENAEWEKRESRYMDVDDYEEG